MWPKFLMHAKSQSDLRALTDLRCAVCSERVWMMVGSEAYLAMALMEGEDQVNYSFSGKRYGKLISRY